MVEVIPIARQIAEALEAAHGLLVSEDLSPVALRRIFQVDPVSGRRVLWREFVPRDPAGVMIVYSAVVTPDGRSYSYGDTAPSVPCILSTGR